MSAIATVLAAMGHRVSGSDLKESAGLERLRALGVDGHRRPRRRQPARRRSTLVTISTAIPDRNPEVVGGPRAGRARCCAGPTMLAAIAATRRTVAVAGTHGKTTTSSMLALVLHRGRAATRRSSSAATSTRSAPARSGTTGEWFVVEADESDGTFLELPRHGAVVTNVEPDHLEFYGGVRARSQAAFDRFLAETTGPAGRVRRRRRSPPSSGAAAGAVTYGTVRRRRLPHGRPRRAAGAARASRVAHDGERPRARCTLPVAGPAQRPQRVRRRWSWACELGAPFEAGRAALARFAGVARRFEHRGEVDGVTFVDDYAHLPDRGGQRAVGRRATAAGAGSSACSSRTATAAPRRCGPTSPTPSATPTCWCVTDIYPSGEAPRPGRLGQARRRRRARRPPVAPAGLPAPPGRRRRLPGRPSCAPATCASPSGPAT